MNTQDVSPATNAPIRHLICPDLEMHIEAPPPDAERRHGLRFARRLQGVMTADGRDYPVTCLDIGYGGIRVLAPNEAVVTAGANVGVRIDLGKRTFRDEFAVVGRESTAAGTMVHLAL